MKFLIVLLMTLSFSAIAQNTKITSFAQAKRNLRKLYQKTSLERKTIYCGCDFNKKKIDTKKCGFKLKMKMKKGKMQGMYSKRVSLEWLSTPKNILIQ